MNLTSARRGEVFGKVSRPWSAGAGSQVLTIGLTEVVFILENIKRKLNLSRTTFLDWLVFRESKGGIFLWEAFVTHASKGSDDLADAEKAVKSFSDCLSNIQDANAIIEASIHSLIGAALLLTGWSKDITLLETACIVIKS